MKLFGKNLLFANIKYKDIQTEKDKSFRIFGTDKSISLLCSKDINQYFIGTTYKCLPNDLEDAKSFLVLIGSNNKKDFFQLVLVAILSCEDYDLYYSFYNFLKNTYNWKPNYLTFDFGATNLKAIKEIFGDKENTVIYK